MKKDKKWLLNELKEMLESPKTNIAALDTGYELAIKDLKESIMQLDEPEKPAIPKFVADWIEENKGYGFLRAYELLYEEIKEYKADEQLVYYLQQSRSNQESFARAWLDGYEVEKEPMWVVRYEDGYFSEEINFGCGIDGDWVDEVSRAYHFVDKSKAEAVALLIGGTVEEVLS